MLDRSIVDMIVARDGSSEQAARESALDTLRLALDCGWANARIERDDDLDSLRDTPEFQEILAEVRSRL